jgi:Trk-type K+ transport system membrane component
MSSWSTGGFAPMSQNLLYYHSFSYEIWTIIFFILGSFNFGLHFAIWKGNRKEIFKNIETKTFFITATLTSILIILALPNLVTILVHCLYLGEEFIIYYLLIQLQVLLIYTQNNLSLNGVILEFSLWL